MASSTNQSDRLHYTSDNNNASVVNNHNEINNTNRNEVIMKANISQKRKHFFQYCSKYRHIGFKPNNNINNYYSSLNANITPLTNKIKESINVFRTPIAKVHKGLVLSKPPKKFGLTERTNVAFMRTVLPENKCNSVTNSKSQMNNLTHSKSQQQYKTMSVSYNNNNNGHKTASAVRYPHLDKIILKMYQTAEHKMNKKVGNSSKSGNNSKNNHSMLSDESLYEIENRKQAYDYYNHNQTLNLFNRQPVDKIPYILPSVFTFNNAYSSKSEKARHIKLMEGLNRLKECIERNKPNAHTYIKDFLTKYNLYSHSEFSQNQLNNIEHIITNNNYIPILKPNNSQKQMIKDIVEHEQSTINSNNSNSSSNNKINSMEWFKYISPFIKGRNTKQHVKECNGNNHANYTEDDLIINPYSNLHHQMKLYAQDKDYAINRNLLIKDISAELELIKYERDKDRINIGKCLNKKNSTNSFSFLTSTPLLTVNNIVNYNNNNNSNSNKLATPEEDITFRLTNAKRMMQNSFSIKEVNLHNINSNNNSATITQEHKTVHLTNKYFQTHSKKRLKEINERLYYKPLYKPISMDDFRKRKKLTEYIALNSARNNLYINEKNKQYEIK